jgi:hypothetical protein
MARAMPGEKSRPTIHRITVSDAVPLRGRYADVTDTLNRCKPLLSPASRPSDRSRSTGITPEEP